MTFTEFIKSLTTDEVNTWWDEKAPNIAPETDEKNNWKYRLRKNGKSLPFKWSIEALAAHYSIPFTSKNFNSDLSSRDAFCEAFDFEIEEELVYDKTEASKFIKLYEKFVNTRDTFQKFLNYAHNLVAKHGVDAYKIRMAITKQDKEAMVVIGMRNVISYTEIDGMAIVGFIVDESVLSGLDADSIHDKTNYIGDASKKLVLRLRVSDWQKIPATILENHDAEFLSAYSHVKDMKIAKWNEEAKTTNSALKYLIFKGLDAADWVLQEKTKQKNMKSSEQKGLESNSGENTISKMPLNQILYGPPGTGKTYLLQEKYFSLFKDSGKKRTKEEFEAEIVSQLPWWKVIALILLESGEMSVPDMKAHRFTKYKLSVSNTKSLNQTFWGQLSSHTVEESTTVDYSSRSKTLVFNKKEEGSVWFIEESKKFDLLDLANAISEIADFQEESNDKENYKFVTFHQSYAYEDFVIGIKPKLEENESNGISEELQYSLVKGRFYEACDEASKLAGYLSLKDAIENYDKEHRKQSFTNPKPFGIFIDEINRGNVSAIFGELITLIEEDKRLGTKNEMILDIPNSKNKFGVPPNLYIIGTMNTADRSVEALDTALRRRFVFEEMMPKPELLKDRGENNSGQIQGIDLSSLLEIMNKRIEVLVDRDHTIGHAFFMDNKNIDDLRSTFGNKIIPLLQEYFYGDYAKMMMVIGEEFFQPQMDASKIEFAANYAEYRPEGKVLNLKSLADKAQFSDEQFIAALRKMINPKGSGVE